MNNSKHTPAPWTVGFSQHGRECVWLNGKSEPRPPLEFGMGDPEDWIDCNTESNARLIAAAPDLLEALDTLTTVVGLTAFKYEAQRAVLQEACDKGRAAINKAKGGGL